jgi:16S rRNA (cytosine967-C5)-methyltransferase
VSRAGTSQAATARSATSRSVALLALVEIDRGARANVALPRLLRESGLSGRDRAFATDLVYGTVRLRRACDWLADRHVRRPLDPDVRAAVRLGTYQLVFLGTPAHAAVSATVAEVTGPGRSVVNAVLRQVAEDLAAGSPTWPDVATELSYPEWIVSRLEDDLGPAAALAALREMNRPAPMTTRPDGYAQDLASQWVAAAVALGVGDAPAALIADLCAAPGGKATAMGYGCRAGHIAWPLRRGDRSAAGGGDAGAGRGPEGAGDGGRGPGGGDDASQAPGPAAAPESELARPLVVAGDVDAARSRVVAASAARLGLANVHAVVADARRPPLRAAHFDRVLVDAPCSGFGVLRRRPDARWRIRPDDVTRLAGLQRQLLEAALPLVRPGGLLFYSVCTLTRAETAAIDQWLARSHPEVRPVRPALGPAWEPAGRGARLLPQAAGTDGMFLLALRVGDGAPAGSASEGR